MLGLHLLRDVLDLLEDRLWSDSMFRIVRDLDIAAALCLAYRALKRACHLVGVENDFSFGVTCRASDGLDQGCLTAQKSFLIGIKDSNERDLRKVESFAKQVDSDDDVELSAAELRQNLDALDSLDVAVQIFGLYLFLFEICRKVLGHFFGQGRCDDAKAALDGLLGLGNEVLDLSAVGTVFHDRADHDLRVDKSGRTDDLLDYLLAFAALVVGRGRRRVDHLAHALFELVILERTVVLCGRQAESELDKVFLARLVASIHGAELRHSDMRLVDDSEEIRRAVCLVREIRDQGLRRLTRLLAGEMARIVFDAVAVSDLADHGEVVVRAALQAFRFEELAFLLEFCELHLEFGLNALDGALLLRAAGHEMLCREEENILHLFEDLGRHWLDDKNAAYGIAFEEYLVHVCLGDRHDIHAISNGTELRRVHVRIRALEMVADELAHDLGLGCLHADGELEIVFAILLRGSETIDARDGRDDDDIAASEERLGRCMAKAIYFLVDRCVLFDIRVRDRKIRLGLVEVVVRDKVMHGSVRKELSIFLRELRGQRLVMRDDERWLVELLDHVCPGECLSRAGNAKKGLLAHTLFEAANEPFYRKRLVSRRFVFGFEFKYAHWCCMGYYVARAEQ